MMYARYIVTTLLALVVPVLAAGCGPSPQTPAPALPSGASEDVSAQVHQFCGACHAYPPAETFPRWAWKDEVERGYLFFNQSGLPLQVPPIDAVVGYYEARAPAELPAAAIERASTPLPVRFAKAAWPGPSSATPAAVSHLNLVHLTGAKRPQVLACDMRRGQILLFDPSAKEPAVRVLYDAGPEKGFNPAHAEVVDLDGDGIRDLLVANLGSFLPTDRRVGSVVWLRGGRDGRFTPVTLLQGVGRVADVQAADFRGSGRKDLVVAAYGWHTTGEILLLENHTADWSQPKFVARSLDDRHGGIHVPVVDLNGDGRPDFVALIAQEHETVVAFLNEGSGRFRKEEIYTAPHPGYGSSGIQLVDLDRDGDLDLLYTNGDTLDKPYILKPYHGIQWLENPGGKFPFTHHAVAALYGVHRALAADFDGDADLDIVAVSFLPAPAFAQRKEKNLDAIILLEQTAPGRFARHSLETVTCDHVTCAVGDIFGSGRPDLVTAVFSSFPSDQLLTIWQNQEPAKR